MTTKHYLINKLDTELSLKSGYLNIKPRSFAEIQVWDMENESIKYAIERLWAEFSDTKPTEDSSKAAEMKIEIAEPYKGMTFEELQEDKAAKEKAKEEAAAAKKAEAEVKEEAEPEPVVITEITLPEPAAPAAKTKKSK